MATKDVRIPLSVPIKVQQKGKNGESQILHEVVLRKGDGAYGNVTSYNRLLPRVGNEPEWLKTILGIPIYGGPILTFSDPNDG